MTKVSKTFFLGTLAGTGALSLLLEIWAYSRIPARAATTWMVPYHNIMSGGQSVEEARKLLWASFYPSFITLGLTLILVYKMWEVIQDGHARTSPTAAVGFLLVPFFNLYWEFIAFWGFARDYNSFIERHSVKAPKLPEALFLCNAIISVGMAVFFQVGLTVFILLSLVGYPIGLIMVSKICDGINALPVTKDYTVRVLEP